MHVEHGHGRHLLQDATGRQPGCQIAQATAKGDVQTGGDKRDEDVSLHAIFLLVEVRAQGKVAFEVLEGFLDLGELDVEFPELAGVVAAKIAAQEVTAFAPESRAKFVLI